MSIAGIPFDFVLFALTLLGVVLFHARTLQVALAGVALSNMYPEARSVGAWLKGGWHVAVGCVAGVFVMLALLGWHPHPINERAASQPVMAAPVAKP